MAITVENKNYRFALETRGVAMDIPQGNFSEVEKAEFAMRNAQLRATLALVDAVNELTEKVVRLTEQVTRSSYQDKMAKEIGDL
jgi:hypothetical protein